MGRVFVVIILAGIVLTSVSFGSSGWVAGKTGNALAFDGTDDYVEVPGYYGIGGASARTVSLWIKTSTTGKTQTLMQWGANSTGQLWMIYILSTNVIQVAAYGGGVYSTATVTDGAWHHVAVVLDEGQTSSSQIRLYIDGVLDTTALTPSCTINTDQTVPVQLGTWYSSSTGTRSNYFPGLMDDVCIYDRALDASEIISEDEIPTDGLVAHWAMDETEGITIHDSASSYDGILKGVSYSGGNGIAEDPFLIYTAEQMNAIGTNSGHWGKYFKLMADIDMSAYTGTQYNIIGNTSTYFSGTFDGNGHIISNLTYNTTSKVSYVGLFGSVGGGTIKNLKLENVSISTAGDYVGGLAGYQNNGAITDCHSQGTVTTTSSYAGGLVGYQYGGNPAISVTIANCCSMGSVTSSSYAGGLVGYQKKNCIITNCFSTSAVTSSYAGGLVGYQEYGSTITNCYSTGNIACNASSSDSSHLGGLIGCQYGTITDSHSTGDVTSSALFSSNVGGVVGTSSGTVIRCYSTGAVTASGSGYSSVGGLIGTTSGTVTSCYSTGSADSSGGMSLSISSYAGGLVGSQGLDSIITNCYSKGVVSCSSGRAYAGGLVGRSYATIDKCYSMGAVSVNGTYYPFQGGLLGYGDIGNLSVSNSFWDIETSGQPSSWSGAGKTTTEMKTAVNFISTGWLFEWPMWVAGRVGNAMSFDGTDDYVEVPGYYGIGGTTARTVSLWVKTSTTGKTQTLMQWGANSTGQLWMIYILPTNVIQVAAYGGGVYSTATVTDGAWHHVAVVLDEGQISSSQIRLYIDGILDATATAQCAIDTAMTVPVQLGAWYSSSAGTRSNYFSGLMDDVCIYNRALDASEIVPENPIPTDGLVAHWAMDETEGLVAYDSISSYDGELKNMSESGAVWTICEGTNYPRLLWQIPEGDWVCPDGVNTEDLDYFVEQWLLSNCTISNNYCGGADMDSSGTVDMADLAVFAGHWLEGM